MKSTGPYPLLAGLLAAFLQLAFSVAFLAAFPQLIGGTSLAHNGSTTPRDPFVFEKTAAMDQMEIFHFAANISVESQPFGVATHGRYESASNGSANGKQECSDHKTGIDAVVESRTSTGIMDPSKDANDWRAESAKIRKTAAGPAAKHKAQVSPGSQAPVRTAAPASSAPEKLESAVMNRADFQKRRVARRRTSRNASVIAVTERSVTTQSGQLKTENEVERMGDGRRQLTDIDQADAGSARFSSVTHSAAAKDNGNTGAAAAVAEQHQSPARTPPPAETIIN